MAETENTNFDVAALFKRIDDLEKNAVSQAEKIEALEKKNASQDKRLATIDDIVKKTNTGLDEKLESINAMLTDRPVVADPAQDDLFAWAAIVLPKYFANERPAPRTSPINDPDAPQDATPALQTI